MILEHLPKSRRNMINNPGWQKPEIKSYLHQISLDCIKKLVDCVEQFIKGEIDAVFYEFAIEGFLEMMGYIAQRGYTSGHTGI